jgi:restriction endonuclease Mrr
MVQLALEIIMAEINNKKHFRKRKSKTPVRDNYIPEGSPELLEKSVDGLGLSERTLNVLKKGGVKTLADLLKFRERELYKIQNFNKKNLMEVSEKVKELKLKFRPDEKNDRIKVLPDGRIEDRRVGHRDRFSDPVSSGRKPDRGGRTIREEKPRDSLIKFMRDGKYGFKDYKGNVVIQPVYSDAFNFKEGLCCAELNGLYGYIDKDNNTVIPFKYELAMSFSEGFACVTVNEKSGYIDKQGNVVIDLIYDAATPFSEGSARAKIDGKWGILTPDGKIKML